MILYFTGSDTFNGVSIPSKSLGGYVSSTLVPNESLNGIFGAISEYGKTITKAQYIILVILNDSEATYTNVRVWMDRTDFGDSDTLDAPYARMKIAEMEVEADDCADLVTTERLPGSYSKPFTVTMVEAEGEENALDFADIEAGMYRALVISREILSAAMEPLTTEQYEAIMDSELSQVQVENFDLKISFDP